MKYPNKNERDDRLEQINDLLQVLYNQSTELENNIRLLEKEQKMLNQFISKIKIDKIAKN